MSVVGIDLGTTNTVVACVRAGKVHVLADEHGHRLLPSVVSFHPNGEVLVGGAARARRVIDPRNTVYSHKRLIGRSWGSPEIVQAKQRFAFDLREGPGQGPLVHARGHDYTLPEMSAFVLKRARQIAETAMGTPVERAVITVPAHFNELQRASTKVAGRVSGLEVLRILNEPTAAALAYGLGRSGNERVAVYDFGGGTFDCTLLDLSGNVFEVLATAGDSFLGGDDVDAIISERMAESFLKAHRIDPRTDPSMLERLRTSAEEIKIQLSVAETHTVVLKEMAHGLGGSSIHFTFTMSRRDLEAAVTPLVDRTFKVTQDALSLARLTPTGFDKVILVGGSTRMPLVRKRVEAFFGTAPLDRVNPDEVVAIGAAIQAAALTEGQKRRSIPAPPPVPGQQRTSPGMPQADDPTTTAIAPSAAPGPGFGAPPSRLGFEGGAPSTKPGPPLPGATASSRKITAPGVAPPTQPMPAARAKAGSVAGQGDGDDPSFASFPDLNVPTPFEWIPSSGGPASGKPEADRSLAGQTINTVTRTAFDPSGVGTTPPRELEEDERSFGDFGTVPEPSLLSMPSFPSLPSLTTAQATMTAAQEPEPFDPNAFGDLGDLSLASTPSATYDSRVSGTASAPSSPGASADGGFGSIRDLSIVSSPGLPSPVTPRAVPPRAGAVPVPSRALPSSSEGDFGQIRDLSIASTSAETNAIEAITEARRAALEGSFGATSEDDLLETDENTAAMQRGPGGTVDLPAHLNPSARRPTAAAPQQDEAADLPALVPTADLPSVSRGQPSSRKPGQLGMGPGGGAAMAGKPPPLFAPQPFGPMERREDDLPSQHTAALPAPAAARPSAPPARAPARPPPTPPTTSPMAARAAPTQLSPAARPAASAPPAFAATLASPGPLAPPGGSAPPPAYPVTAPMPATPMQNAPIPPAPTTASGPYGMSGSGPYAAQPGHPPPGVSGSHPPAPPPFGASGSGPYASQPPAGPHGSAPPVFGAYPSSPPGAPPDPPPYARSLPPGPAPGMSFAAPVLVDVTPRALIVETAGGYTDTIIPRNSKIPCERTRRFATGRDMQTTVRVRVAQGEHAHFPQNMYLGEVELSGLRPAPRGEVTVAVTFEVDADGSLRVRARDVQTGQEARATLHLQGVADESSVVMMIDRFAQQPVTGNGPSGPVS